MRIEAERERLPAFCARGPLHGATCAAINVANSLVVLAAAFQGSSGAVLRGKSLEPSSQHGQGNALALAGGQNDASLEARNVPGGMFHGGHRVPTAVLEIVRRTSTAGVAVPEQELKELIADVHDVEQRLSALMKGQAAALTPGGQVPDGAAAGTGSSGSSGGSLPADAASDPDKQEGTATGAPDFVTLTEYIFDDPTPLPVAASLSSDLEGLSVIVDDTSASENLSANLEAIPTGVDDTALLGMALASPGAPEASASLPSSAAALEAAPEATLPPAPAEVVAQEARSVAPGAEPAAAAVSAAPSGPGIMTLAFPGDDASAIAWRTIALP
ncbi:hypothetical protein HYQ45_006625 [Verticillium longisporum]|uniref:Uncharacterized protein n=1 Tax=Verticillium longisporum TaxID=100787 RepID=A0A8I3AQX1_VERLO|nr:hypothetical protein HYQ45_006625 [Verticillium longisporum]